MRLIIAGGREFDDEALFEEMMRHFQTSKIDVVLSGKCPTGADAMGEKWAARRGIRIEEHPANWTAHGKRAGYVRNLEMAERADALVAFWDGASRGTKMMIDLANQHGLVTYVRLYGAGLKEFTP